MGQGGPKLGSLGARMRCQRDFLANQKGDKFRTDFCIEVGMMFNSFLDFPEVEFLLVFAKAKIKFSRMIISHLNNPLLSVFDANMTPKTFAKWNQIGPNLAKLSPSWPKLAPSGPKMSKVVPRKSGKTLIFKKRTGHLKKSRGTGNQEKR